MEKKSLFPALRKKFIVLFSITMLLYCFLNGQSISKNESNITVTRLFPENQDTIVNIFENTNSNEVYRVYKSYCGKMKSTDDDEYYIYKYGIIKPNGAKYELTPNEEIILMRNDTVFTFKPYWGIPGIDSIVIPGTDINPETYLNLNQINKYIIKENRLVKIKSVRTNINFIQCIDKEKGLFFGDLFYDIGETIKIYSSDLILLNEYVPYQNGFDWSSWSIGDNKLILSLFQADKPKSDSIKICYYDMNKNSFNDKVFGFHGYRIARAIVSGKYLIISLWNIDDTIIKQVIYDLSTWEKIREQELSNLFLDCIVTKTLCNENDIYLISRKFQNFNDPFILKTNIITGFSSTRLTLNDLFNGEFEHEYFAQNISYIQQLEPVFQNKMNTIMFSNFIGTNEWNPFNNGLIILFNTNKFFKIYLPDILYSCKLITVKNYFYLTYNNKIYKYEYK